MRGSLEVVLLYQEARQLPGDSRRQNGVKSPPILNRYHIVNRIVGSRRYLMELSCEEKACRVALFIAMAAKLAYRA